METKPIVDAETALKRAVLWLSALIRETDADPDECTIRVTVKSGEGRKVLAEINLAEDLEAFKAFGGEPDFFSEAEEV